MSNTIESHCSECDSDTFFVFDSEDWECQSCGAYNTNDSND